MRDFSHDETNPKKEKPSKPEEKKGRRTGPRTGPKAFDRGKTGRPIRPPERTPKSKEYVFIAEHTVVAGETLSGLAKKYHGSEAQANWMEIYEANKDVIGDSPNVILVGQVLKIPERPTSS
jgi:nucleoid-associated protein YgaU